MPKSSYSSAGEIHRYFERVAVKYDLLKYVKLNHQVIKARWDQQEFRWHLTVKNAVTGETITDSGDVLISGGGIVK